MTTYAYRAVDRAGTDASGTVVAESLTTARQLIRERGLFPVLVVGDRADPGAMPGGRLLAHRLGGGELCLMTQQWASLLAAGLTVESALNALSEQAAGSSARRVLAGVREQIVAGHTLRSALDRYPESFPTIYRAAVAAGEKSGELARVMAGLADHLERRRALRQKTLQALLYPAIVAAVAVLVVLGLLTYVVPQVAAVFQQGKQALPLLTRALIAIAAALRQWGGWAFLAVAAAGIATAMALRLDALRRRWDARLLAIPLVGHHLLALDAARFASTLAILVGSGVPLLAALDAGRQVLARLPLRDAVADAADRVREGMALAAALARTGRFPPLLVHMVANGEATGRLGELLERAARLQQNEVENRGAILAAVAEPLLLLAMGAIVLVIVLAVMEPIIEINHLLH